LPAFTYVVVDQNQIRRDEVMVPLLAKLRGAGERVMLPSTAEYEMTKGSGNTFRGATKHLVSCPEMVSSAFASLPDLVSQELRLRAIVRNIEDHESTANLRALLGYMRNESPTDEELRLQLAPAAAAAAARFESNDYVTLFKAGVQGLAVKNLERTAVTRALSAGNRVPFQDALLESLNIDNLANLLAGVKALARRSRCLASFPSVAALSMIATLAVSLRWSMSGGIPANMPLWKLENEGPDMETVVVSLYGRGLVAEDGNVRGLFEDMKAVVTRIWGYSVDHLSLEP
jgi:hypothetical protein